MTTPASVDPADFGDATAFDLGEYQGTGFGTIDMAVGRVRTLLDGLSQGFGIEKVQFFFNGTPAVMSVKDTPADVLRDWNTRRDSYQRAAGVV